MSTNRIATTPKSQVQSLAYQGIHVHDCYHQVREIVRTKFGDDYALLFAEPSMHQDGSAIDWYSPVRGPVQPLTALPEAQQNDIRNTIVRMARDIQGEAADIQRLGSSEKIIRGNILELALRYPSEDHIYVIGGQPVITCWGFGIGDETLPPQDLARLCTTTTPAPSPQPIPEAAQSSLVALRRGCLFWWLLPLLFLLLLLLALCSPVILAPDIYNSPPKNITEESLVIPPTKETLHFLQGQWWCDRGLVNKSDKQPIIVMYRFDAQGQGQVIIRQKDREDCVGAARAEMADNTTLRVHAARQECPDGRAYAAETLECRPDASGKAQCTGVSADGTHWGGSAPFYRVQ